MYRAKKLFEKEGFDVVPYKVDYKVSRRKVTNIMDFLPDAEALKLTGTGIRKLWEGYSIY